MALDYDPRTSIRQWPMASMERYGKNLFGENLYRIVFAPSRRHIVYGEWADGTRKASYVKTYPHLGNCWVLERWLTPYQYARCTEQQWNETMTILGPYPSRGEYDVCHVFSAVPPGDSNLDKLIRWIEMGQERSFSENRAAVQESADQEEKERTAQIRGIIQESLPAFGTSAMAGYGGARGTKTAPVLRTAEELGLPTRRGQSRVLPSRSKVKVKVDTEKGTARV